MHDGPRPGMDEHEGLDQRMEMPRMDHGMLMLGTWKSKSTWVMKTVFTRVKARVGPVKVRHHEHLVHCRAKDMKVGLSTAGSDREPLT
jgi:hypothetical protein